MRLTNHNARVAGSRHNDRNFDLTHAPHIDASRTDENRYWHCYQKTDPRLTFEQAEHLFYDKTFGDHLEAQNARHRKARHVERCKDFLDYYKSKRTCPEETIMQIGRKGKTVSGEKLWEVAREQLLWERETFPQVKQLSISLHMDEATPHIHSRKVYVAYDDEGRAYVSQSKALEQMGIRDPEGRRDRYHNAKVEYSRMCREHFMELCREHGLEIETEPLEPSRVGLDLLAYQTRQEKEQLERLHETVQEASQELSELKASISAKYDELSHAEALTEHTGRLTLALKALTDREKLDTLFKQAHEYVKHRDQLDKLDDAERIREEAQQVLKRAKTEAGQIIDDARHEAEDMSMDLRVRQEQELVDLRRKAKRYDQAKDLMQEKYGLDIDDMIRQEQTQTHKRSVSLSRG